MKKQDNTLNDGSEDQKLKYFWKGADDSNYVAKILLNQSKRIAESFFMNLPPKIQTEPEQKIWAFSGEKLE